MWLSTLLEQCMVVSTYSQAYWFLLTGDDFNPSKGFVESCSWNETQWSFNANCTHCTWPTRETPSPSCPGGAAWPVFSWTSHHYLITFLLLPLSRTIKNSWCFPQEGSLELCWQPLKKSRPLWEGLGGKWVSYKVSDYCFIIFTDFFSVIFKQ